MLGSSVCSGRELCSTFLHHKHWGGRLSFCLDRLYCSVQVHLMFSNPPLHDRTRIPPSLPKSKVQGEGLSNCLKLSEQYVCVLRDVFWHSVGWLLNTTIITIQTGNFCRCGSHGWSASSAITQPIAQPIAVWFQWIISRWARMGSICHTSVVSTTQSARDVLWWCKYWLF